MQYKDKQNLESDDDGFTMYDAEPEAPGCSKTFTTTFLFLTGTLAIGSAIMAIWLLVGALSLQSGLRGIAFLGVLFSLLVSGASFWALIRFYNYLNK